MAFPTDGDYRIREDRQRNGTSLFYIEKYDGTDTDLGGYWQRLHEHRPQDLFYAREILKQLRDKQIVETRYHD